SFSDSRRRRDLYRIPTRRSSDLLTSTGVVTQAAPLTIGGNLDVVTTVNAGDVTLDNSGASATIIGNTLVGGNYVLTATGDPVSQDRKSTRLNSSHVKISYAVFCL